MIIYIFFTEGSAVFKRKFIAGKYNNVFSTGKIKYFTSACGAQKRPLIWSQIKEKKFADRENLFFC